MLLAVPALAAPLAAGCAASPTAEHVLQVAETTGASAVGSAGLAQGFPDVVPVPPGARVTDSAMQVRGDVLGVSVAGTSPMPVAGLLAWFRARLRAEGFTATDPLLPPGASGAAFGRPGGVELLLVAVVDRGTLRSWSVGGTIAVRRGHR
ncbi:MAG TPA: hypothetical protein VI248_07355 [Kineosporiaceae bacterium]